MSTIRLATCIVHAVHLDARRPLYQRLRRELGLDAHSGTRAMLTEPHCLNVEWTTETTRGPYWVWHELVLRWFLAAAERGATHCLTIQDDVTVSPSFWADVRDIIRRHPHEIICLDCAHPGARQVFVEGGAGYTTVDGLIGIAHIEPIDVVRDFFEWRLRELQPHALERVSEDTLLGLYAMDRGMRIFSPVPSPVDHDLDATSSYANDTHLYRRPQVTWREEGRGPEHRKGAIVEEAPHFGRFYENAHEHLPLVLKDKERAGELLVEYAGDLCPKKYARFFSRVASFT